MKIATSIWKNGQVFTQGYSETGSGLWIASGQVYVSIYGNSKQMAEQARDALNSSQQGVLHPGQDEWVSIQRPMLEAVGASDWSALARGAKAVSLELEAGIVTLSPSADYESEGGSDLIGQEIEIEIGSEKLGDLLILAFERCV